MSIPGLNPTALPAQDPPPVPPQIPPPPPGSPTLRNRSAQQHEHAQEDAVSQRGLKRGRATEVDEEGMEIEASTEPAMKRRRSEGEAATPERLQALIDAGDESSLRTLLQQAPELLNSCYPKPILEGLTPLCYAASKGLEAMVCCLVDCNASLEAPSICSVTPLMGACGGGHLRVSQILQRAGANLVAKNVHGNNCLHFAANQGHHEMVKWLLSLNIPFDEPNMSGNSPLMMACGEGHLKVVQLLLEAGANLDAKNAKGNNCLNLAVLKNRPLVVKWLLEQGISINDSDVMRQPLLSQAFNKRYWETVGALIAGGANLNVATENQVLLGNKIFKQAIESGRYDVLQSLLEKKWPLPKGWDDLGPVNLPNESSEAQREQTVIRRRHAEIRDLARVFCGANESNRSLDAAWLSPEGESERRYFIDFYLNHFFKHDGEPLDQRLEDFNISQHPLFSHTIHHYLKHELSEPAQLLQALAGADRSIPASYQKKVLWFKLQALTHSEQFKASFQNRYLASDSEDMMINILAQQLEALLTAAEAYFSEPIANFPDMLTQLCRKYLKIAGDFDAAGFSKALSKQGIYAINANRLAVLISQTWENICRRPLGLSPTETATLGQMFQQRGPFAIRSLLAEIKVAVTERPDTSTLAGFRESFREGFMMTERQYLETYSEEIFGQWRQMWAGLGVILPEPFAAQQ